MIEIVFGESACGSLKIAQTYGKGKYRGSAVSIFMRHEDGSVPSSDEMKKAQLQAQEQERIAWENAIPLGGKSCDVYCFDMALSVGDISDNGIGEQRKNVFKKMLSVCFVEDLDYSLTGEAKQKGGCHDYYFLCYLIHIHLFFMIVFTLFPELSYWYCIGL